jgi:hypothetical protein
MGTSSQKIVAIAIVDRLNISATIVSEATV